MLKDQSVRLKRSALLIVLGLGALAPHPSVAIEIGEPAPPLHVTTWVKGQPVDLVKAKSNQIVVVEFWATWCPPCRRSIPNLTALQAKYKDVAIVGLSDESPALVRKFVAKMGNQMNYIVGVDESGQTVSAYMAEFGPQLPIPYAFILDKQGLVLWKGPALLGLDTALAEAVAGTLTVAKSKMRQEGKKLLEQFVEAVRAGRDEAQTAPLAAELEKLDAASGGIEPGVKFSAADIRQRIKFEGLQQAYMKAVLSGASGTNVTQLEQELDQTVPKGYDLAGFKVMVALNKTCNDYFECLEGKRDASDLPKLTKIISEAKIQNPRILLQIAWSILQVDPARRDLALATKLARSAVDLSEEKDIDALFVYGRVLLTAGKNSDAIVWQKKAIAAAGDDEETVARLQATLQEYEAAAKK